MMSRAVGSTILLDGFAVVIALSEQLQIGLDVGIGWVLGLRLFERLVGSGVIAAQHVGEALVVKEFRCRAEDLEGLGLGAVGKIETTQPVIRRREPDPGLGIARMLFYGAAVASLS